MCAERMRWAEHSLRMYRRLSPSNLNSRLESDISPAGVVSTIFLNSEDMPRCHLIRLASNSS